MDAVYDGGEGVVMRNAVLAVALIGGTLASMCCIYMLGAHNGYVSGHSKVASECRKLGAFYVADDVFTCEVVE